MGTESGLRVYKCIRELGHRILAGDGDQFGSWQSRAAMEKSRVSLTRSALWLLCATVLVVGNAWVCEARQRGSPKFSGSWLASTAGDRYFRGMWSGELSEANRNAAGGSWMLLSDAGEVILQGTWSARKTAQEWEGSWTARTARGETFSGSWNADLAAFAGKTLEEMLKRTQEKQVAGGWKSGRYQGYWWLEGLGGKGKRK